MKNENKIINPILPNEAVTLVGTIESKFLVDKYRDTLRTDVSSYFSNLEKVKIYRSPETDFAFYYPLTLTGGKELYESLQQFSWYYMPWRWEHQEARKYFKSKDRVLEVGCGPGDFIGRLKKDGMEVVGLEFNEKAVAAGRSAGLNILQDTMEQHAKSNQETYDVVCFFEVLEHIPDVRNFLENAIRTLKRKGKLIIAVPNNDSFIKYDPALVLNMPPHHMGLWNKRSLTYLQKILGLKVLAVSFEPLQKYHWQNYYNAQLARLSRHPILLKFLKLRLINRIAIRIIRTFSDLIHGQTVLAVYEKI